MADLPCLCLAIKPLAGERRYVTWVLRAPYAGGYGLHEQTWPDELSQLWYLWQTMFSRRSIAPLASLDAQTEALLDLESSASEPSLSMGARLMQRLGVQLWQWLFDEAIRGGLDKSQGLALGQQRSLRLRLELRDANLQALPWEIMQADAGQRAISLGADLLFSRTISDVEPLLPLRRDVELQTLLVVGQPSLDATAGLDLEQDSQILQALQSESGLGASHQVTCLVQPTSAELLAHLEASSYNLFIYAGHGSPGPDGGCLFLRPGAELNGIELAQALTRRQVKLAVFNACWGAQAAQDSSGQIPRSSLAEVLICQGVPAVLGMRDAIADSEAIDFLRAFTQALTRHGLVDRAVAEARQRMLMLYKFNQPAWTLPVLYMHPEFEGQILHRQARLPQEEATEIPNAPATWINQTTPTAALRTMDSPPEYWPIQGGILRVGRGHSNDLVLQEVGVSRQHAEIFYRSATTGTVDAPAYYLKDFSRFGTFVRAGDGWRCVHNQEVPLASKAQIKFGSAQNQLLEFIVDGGD